MSQQTLDLTSVSARIEFLKAELVRVPGHKENIQAIINYYENGGLPPVGGQVVVYTCGDGVKRGTLKEAWIDLKATANGRQPYVDSIAHQLSHSSMASS